MPAPGADGAARRTSEGDYGRGGKLAFVSEGWGGSCVRERFVEEIPLHFFSLVPYVDTHYDTTAG